VELAPPTKQKKKKKKISLQKLIGGVSLTNFSISKNLRVPLTDFSISKKL